MKKFFMVALALAMVISFAACGGSDTGSGGNAGTQTPAGDETLTVGFILIGSETDGGAWEAAKDRPGAA